MAQNYFVDYINRRTTEIENEILKNDQRISILIEQYVIIQNKMLEQLPSEFADLVFKFQTLHLEQRMIINEAIYRQGLMDGMKLKAVFHMTGQFIGGLFKQSKKDCRR